MPTKTVASAKRSRVQARKPAVFIDGEAGTTGLEIRRRLAGVTGVDVKSIPADKRKDEAARLAMMRAADLVVLCLPDEAAREAVALIASLGDAAPKVVDASSAHRVAAGWAYGFPEMSAGQAEINASPNNWSANSPPLKSARVLIKAGKNTSQAAYESVVSSESRRFA
jgi:hypothetical protein